MIIFINRFSLKDADRLVSEKNADFIIAFENGISIEAGLAGIKIV